jgi:hypothetical protein
MTMKLVQGFVLLCLAVGEEPAAPCPPGLHKPSADAECTFCPEDTYPSGMQDRCIPFAANDKLEDVCQRKHEPDAPTLTMRTMSVKQIVQVCETMQDQHNVVSFDSWGNLPFKLHELWGRTHCDKFAMVGARACDDYLVKEL